MQLACATLAIALALGPSSDDDAHPSGLTDEAAQDHFEAGARAWDAKDYATARQELEAAYAIEPAAALLYSLGQLERLLGDCDKAVDRFEAYLETDPPDSAAEDTRMNIARCEPFLEKPSPPTVQPQPAPAAIEPIGPVPSPAPDKTRPDWLGISLTAGGTTLAAVGFGVFGGSFAVQRRAEDEFAVSDFESGVRRARVMYATGLGLATAGVAVAIAGIVRLIVVRKRRR